VLEGPRLPFPGIRLRCRQDGTTSVCQYLCSQFDTSAAELQGKNNYTHLRSELKARCADDCALLRSRGLIAPALDCPSLYRAYSLVDTPSGPRHNANTCFIA